MLQTISFILLILFLLSAIIYYTTKLIIYIVGFDGEIQISKDGDKTTCRFVMYDDEFLTEYPDIRSQRFKVIDMDSRKKQSL